MYSINFFRLTPIVPATIYQATSDRRWIHQKRHGTIPLYFTFILVKEWKVVLSRHTNESRRISFASPIARFTPNYCWIFYPRIVSKTRKLPWQKYESSEHGTSSSSVYHKALLLVLVVLISSLNYQIIRSRNRYIHIAFSALLNHEAANVILCLPRCGLDCDINGQ